MTALKNDLEALKLLADWSKWVIVVETAALAAIGAFWKPEFLGLASCFAKLIMASGVVFFTISIVAAAILLKSLPAAAQRLPREDDKDIFHMGTYEGIQGWPVYRLANIETYAFVAGLICFSLAIAISVLTFQAVTPGVDCQ